MIESVIVLWLVALSIFMWSRRQPAEAPPGYDIIKDGRFTWNYYHQEDAGSGMLSTGYLTRQSAIRAATHEYERRQQINE